MLDSMLIDLATGPKHRATSYSGLWVNGYHFRTRDEDLSKVTQDSGITACFTTWSRSSVRDRNPISTNLRNFGWICKILEIEYGFNSVILLYGKWVKPNIVGKHASMRMDNNGFCLIDVTKTLRQTSMEDQPFVMPEHVQQVFYVQDPMATNWNVVLHHYARGTRDGKDENNVMDFSLVEDFCTTSVDLIVDEEECTSHDVDIVEGHVIDLLTRSPKE